MNNYIIFLSLLFFFNTVELFSRSRFRKIDPRQSYITISFSDEDKKVVFNNPYLQYDPIFKSFNLKSFFQNLIPKNKISYRNQKDASVDGRILSDLAQTAADEIKAGKKKLTHFTFVKKRDFHKKTKTGILILKYNKYPFILKLFIESPQGFANPYGKGFVPSCFFVMSGSLRHVLGFSRIDNLQKIKQKIAQDKYWSKKIDMPRKWFWHPEKIQWLKIQENNMSNGETIEIPSVYGVIVDAIEIDDNPPITRKAHRRLCIDLYNYLQSAIDPHSVNIMSEKDTKKLVLIDTEYFPFIVGFRENNYAKGYASWLMKLSRKYLNDKFGHTKAERFALQQPW